MSRNYEHLKIWEKSVDLSVIVYSLTRSFPKEEMYGLTSQIRRAVVSISCNIAEGAGRNSKQEFIRFINIALGSLNEVESLLLVSRKLEYSTELKYKEIKEKLEELGGLIGGFRKYLSGLGVNK